MKKEQNLYENEYKTDKHFSFGKNWQEFLKTLNSKKTNEAKKSLVNFLGKKNEIRGKTFIDIGCGSGLFSLAAYLLGAKKVVSVDIDEFSIECAKYLRDVQKNPKNWEIKKGSALDKKFIKSLGKFDVVYSWGVLHHTGDMYKAFDNVINLIKPNGIFFLSIYGRGYSKISGTSEFWLKVKKRYNSSGKIIKNLIKYLYYLYFISASFLVFRNPFSNIRNYAKNRGMSFHHDVLDWLGGYPYEFATPEEIINYFGKKDIYCKKIKDHRGIACNEYLLIKKDVQ